MRNGLHPNPVFFKMVLLVTCLMLVMLYNKSKGADAFSAKHVSEKSLQHTVAVR